MEHKYYLDLFSGIGGFALGAYWAGLIFNDHYFSEIDEYAVNLYQKRFPDAIPLGDITKINGGGLPKGDWIITGGFPCQPHSVAGLKKGSEDKRDLWSECVRMLCELRPRFALFENVTGLFNSNGGQFYNRVLSDIHKAGYNAEWQVISGAEIGAPHRRERVWIIAYPQSFRLSKDKLQNKCIKNSSRKEQNQWKQFQSISAGAYKICNWQDHEQIITGTYDGFPEELDAIKGAGNAVIPQIPEMIFNLPVFDEFREA